MAGPKSPPSQVQLPGGVVLRGCPFKIVERHPDGTPKLFELLPRGTKYTGPGAFVLYGDEEQVYSPIGSTAE